MSDKMPGWMLRDLANLALGPTPSVVDFSVRLREEAARREAEAKPQGPLTGIEAGPDAVHPKPPHDGLVPNPPYIGPGSAADELPSELRRAAFDLGQEGDVAGSRLVGNAADRIEALQARMSSMADVAIAQSKTMQAIEQRAEKAEARVARLERLLRYLARRGGLGLDIHDMITAALAEANDAQ
jgi:methylase of polypeptide subunit release factors